MVSVTNLPLARVEGIAALEVHVRDVAVTQLKAFACLGKSLGKFAARVQFVGNRYDILDKRTLEKLELVLGRSVLRLADIGLIAHNAHATQDSDDGYHHQEFDQRKAVFRTAVPLARDISRVLLI